MAKIDKSLVVKTLGVGTGVVLPATGAGTYAVITQKKYEGLYRTIRTLESTNNEQKIKLDNLLRDPENQNREKDRQQIEKTNQENEQLKKDLENERDTKTQQYNSQQAEIAKLKKENQNLRDSRDPNNYTWLANFLCYATITMLNKRWNGYYPSFNVGNGFVEVRRPVIVVNKNGEKKVYTGSEGREWELGTVEEHKKWAEDYLNKSC